MADTHESYVGGELRLFATAVNWKAYWGGLALPSIRGRVLEVGAGLGGTTQALASRASFDQWVCLEPDAALCARIPYAIDGLPGRDRFDIVTGTLGDYVPGETFDTVLYIDTLEHIEDDRAELHRALAVLCKGGRLVVLVPAHNALYSRFDAAIGHYRRYNKRMLRAAMPSALQESQLIYLDCVGLSLSLANRLMLRQSSPTLAQIALWDRRLIPLSKLLDSLTLHLLGKSLLGVWSMEGE